MTREEAIKILEESEWKHDSIDRIYEGLTILHKYDRNGDENWSYSFQHDQFWVGAADFDDYVERMSDEDIKRMGELGWMEDEDSWSHF